MKTQIIVNLIQVLEAIIEVNRNKLKEVGLMQFKKLIVANKIKKMRKININSQQSNQTNFSSTQSKSYNSITPIENNYSSIQIISSQGFDLQQQNKNGVNIQQQSDMLQKPDYIQKYFNQTKKLVQLIENAPFSQFSQKDIYDYDSQVFDKIIQVGYDQYFKSTLEKYINQKGQISKRFNYSSNNISSPLTKLCGTDRSLALDIYHNHILKYDDYTLDDPKCVLASNLSNYIRHLSEEIIEQVYFQIIKQTRGFRFNIYFKLLAVIAATVKVPLRLYWPLLNYFIDKRQEHPVQYSYLFYVMIKNFQQPRQKGIFPFQADLIMNMKKIPIILDFPTQRVFYMEPSSTVEDLIQEIVTHFELDKDKSQYLISYKYGLFQTGNIFDLLYQVETKKYKNNYYTSADRYIIFTGFKVMITYKNLTSCFKINSRMTIFYAYQSKKYIQGVFSLRKYQVGRLAALKYYCENDSIDIADIGLYIPNKYIDQLGQDFWALIMVQNLKSINCTKREARRQFLRQLKKKDCFMAHVLYCDISISTTQQIESAKGFFFLGPGFIHLIGLGQNYLYQRVRMTQIKQYGASRTQLCINYKSYTVYKTAKISCQYQKTINQIFYSYIENLKQKYFKQIEQYLEEFQKQELN